MAAEVTRVVECERAGPAVSIFNAARLIRHGAVRSRVQVAASIAPGASLEALPNDSLAAGLRAVFAAMAVAGAVALAAALGWGARFWRPPKAPADTRERGSGGR